ncbi:MAG: orotidine-5'-phosphate decarboxylase [Oscillospiraceae bacterium]
MDFEVLQSQICKMKNPTVAGLDARLEYVPPQIVKACNEQYGAGLESAVEAIYRFNCGLMDALCDIVPAVKPQSAYYELLGWRGMEMLERTIQYAKSKGFFVIADVKRGDIGSTAQAYAEAWLGKTDVGAADKVSCFGADCVTINGYMGSDSIAPFLDVAKQEGKCVFVLVKTSNPSSGELQNMVAGDRQVYNVMGDLTQRLGKDTASAGFGYQRIGAVVGATYPAEMRELRRRLEKTFFLVPGYGAQGGTAQDVQYAFDHYGRGAIVNSSRGIMCAWQKTGKNGEDYAEAARAAAIAMRDDIKKYVTIV